MRPVELTTDPKSSPHVCIKCRSHAQVRDWFVDIGCDVEWEGYVYLCNECMKDIVRVTPDYMTVASHRELVAQYDKDLDELARLQTRMRKFDEMWNLMVGTDLETFFDNLEKVNDVRSELELGRAVSSAIGSESTTLSNSTEPESDTGSSTEPDSTVDVPVIAFS